MATYDWTGATSGNPATTTNWNPNGTPGNNDTIRALSGAVSIDAGPTTFNANTGMTLEVGKGYTGSIGTSSAALQFGTGFTLKFNGAQVPEAYIDADTDGTGLVSQTGPGENALTLTGGWTQVNVDLARRIIIDATIATLRMMGRGSANDIIAKLNASAALTTVESKWASVLCNTAITTLRLMGRGGIWTHNGATSKNITTLEVFDGLFRGTQNISGLTIATLTVYGGKADLTGVDHATISAGTVRTGGVLDLQNGRQNISKANLTQIGGKILGGTGSATILIGESF